MEPPSGEGNTRVPLRTIPDFSVFGHPSQTIRFLVGAGNLPQIPSSADNMTSETGPSPSSPTTVVASQQSSKVDKVYKVNLDPASPILNLPTDVRARIYKFFFSPAAIVIIYNILGHPAINVPLADKVQIFLVSRLFCREARRVFFGKIHFHLQHPWAISYLTGRMPLETTTDVRFLTTVLDYIPDTTETIKQLFTSLEVLTVRPSPAWYDSWYDYLHIEHRGDVSVAVQGMLEISRDDQQKRIGLYELAHLAKKFTVAVKLLFWPNGKQFPPVEHQLLITDGAWQVLR